MDASIFGLLGANGAGRHTLLKLAARRAPLPALSAGFPRVLPGREKFFWNGAGYSHKQIRARAVATDQIRDILSALNILPTGVSHS